MSRTLFLDFDGVIATSGTYKRARSALIPQAWGPPEKVWTHPGEDLLSAELAANVQELCVLTGAQVVLSTSWRNLYSLETLKGWLTTKGLTAEVVGVTPVLYGKTRGTEIDAFMHTRDLTAQDIVILEDEEDVRPYRARQVKTSFMGSNAGFTKRHLARALKLWV